MEKPSSKVIEITVISAEGLLVNKKRKPAKKNLSVTVRIDPFTSWSTGQADPEGPNCPAWNEKMVMDLPVHARFITVEACSGKKVIGVANIPVTDFGGSQLPDNYLNFLSYRLRDGGGEKNGIVNLSVRVVGGSGGGGDRGCAASCSRPWMGGASGADSKVSGGVVMGIPVQYRY